MKRRALLAAVVVLSTGLIAVPSSSAAPPTYAVSGSFGGSDSIEFTGCTPSPGTPLAIRDRAVLYGDIAPFGDVTMTYDLCILLSSPTDSEADASGAVAITAPGGTVRGVASGWSNAVQSPFPYHLDVVVTGGTGDFSGIVGNLVLDGTTGAPGNAATGTASGTVSYPVPVVTPRSASAVEGGDGATTQLQVPVTLDAPSTDTITVEWTTVFVPGAPEGQADPSEDYTPASGTVTFAPGETAKAAPVTIQGDALVEPNEYIVVAFHDPTDARLGGFWGLGFGAITNDDQTKVVPGIGSVAEGAGPGISEDIQVPVTLSKPSSETVTVQWSTVFVPGAPAGQADPDDDYVPEQGVVTFEPGETEKVVPVPAMGDSLTERDEYIVVAFHHPTGAQMGGFWGLGFGVITNDD